MEVDYRRYQYNIAVPPFNENHPISNFIVPYWKNFWKELLLELNSGEGLQEDEIHWQDRITYITDKHKIVAIHFIARYSKANFSYSSYAKRYLPESFAKEYCGKPGFVNTLQYLNVDPYYNYRKSGINFASILMDVTKFHQAELNAEETITVARRSVGAHNLARKFGFNEYCSSTKHNVDVSIMKTDKPKRHPQKKINIMSDFLWENRNFISTKELPHEC